MVESAVMQIATWNVNGLRARLDFVKHWLAERAPDVVGLQELKMQDAQFPHADFEAAGYRAITHGQKSWNGVAILVRAPLALEHVESGLPGQEDFGARLIRARIGEGAAAVDYTTLYCPNGKAIDHDDFPRKLAWFDALRGWAAKFVADDAPVLLGGDFNIVPAALDSWDEESLRGDIFHTDEERDRLAALLELGLLDLFRERAPEERAFSWWDYRGGAFHRGHGLRIDLLLGTPAIARRLHSVEIDREFRKKKDGLTASDHAPVVATLDPPA
ncbi:MAG: exodeoxyribonuclease III [Spirochaetaceae bacterium]|nr:exodeoxyribonuclease III [Myxococcales bacterium]MCB9724991.1 exodeoxyribonuclease III [Spirochaetaceae bacterium]HPG28298.1 exodeoxyribonuclease III [Myxococcota bacterium]